MKSELVLKIHLSSNRLNLAVFLPAFLAASPHPDFFLLFSLLCVTHIIPFHRLPSRMTAERQRSVHSTNVPQRDRNSSVWAPVSGCVFFSLLRGPSGQRKLWLLERGQSQGDFRAFQGCHLTPGLPRLCPFSLSLLSLALSVNFLHIIHSRPSAHKQFSQVLSLSSMLTLLTHCQHFHSRKPPSLRTTFALHPVIFPFTLSSLACFPCSHLR